MPMMRLCFRLSVVLPLTLLCLAATASPSAALTAGERNQLQGVLRSLATENWSQARSQAGGLPPAVATAVEWHQLVNDDSPPDFDRYVTFLNRYPDWPRQSRLRAMAEEAALLQGGASVPAYFQRFPPTTRDGRRAFARFLWASGQRDAAVPYIKEAWRTGSFLPDDESVFFARYADVLTPDDHRARATNLAYRGISGEALRTTRLLDPGWRALIEARIALRDQTPGVDGAINRVPDALQSNEGLTYERLRWRREKRRDSDALEILLNPPRTFSRPDLWWRERSIFMRRAIERQDWQTAYRIAASHRQTEGSGFSDAEWHAGWIALRYLNRPGDALAHFEKMWDGVDTPISNARAAYWAGRAAAELGRTNDARIWYQRAAAYDIAFYGQQAAVELGRKGGLQAARDLPPVDAGTLAAYRQQPLSQLTLMLGQVDDTMILPSAATQLVRNAKTLQEYSLAIQVAQDARRYDAAISGYIAMAQLGLVSAGASHPIPPFVGLNRPSDPAVSPALALAIARQESRFVPYAVSRAGARGLMQLMPGTAQAVSRQQGLSYAPAKLTADPDYNARLGTAYLGDLLRRFDDTGLAAAGYNAGPGRSVEWINANGDPRRMDRYDRIDWIERIPFRETRNYVQRIIEGEYVYEQLLAGGGTRASADAAASAPTPSGPAPVPLRRPGG